jgi:hypothetical protein
MTHDVIVHLAAQTGLGYRLQPGQFQSGWRMVQLDEGVPAGGVAAVPTTFNPVGYDDDGGPLSGALGSTPSTVYATARATGPSNGFVIGGAGQRFLLVGQEITSTYYSCYEGFVGFDLSDLSGTLTVATATLRVYSTPDVNTQFVFQVRSYPYSTPIGNATWIAGASLAGYDLLGSLDTTGGMGAGAGWFEIDIDVAGVTPGELVQFVLCSDHHADGVSPLGTSGSEVVSISLPSPIAALSPQLVLTYA